jgi:hypothetical protein
MPVLTLVSPLSSSAAGLDTAMRQMAPKGRARKSTAGVLSIRNTWNNTLVTISDMEYKVKGWMTAGAAGFKKSKRSSYFAMEKCLSDAFLKARAVSSPPTSTTDASCLQAHAGPQHFILTAPRASAPPARAVGFSQSDDQYDRSRNHVTETFAAAIARAVAAANHEAAAVGFSPSRGLPTTQGQAEKVQDEGSQVRVPALA